MLYSTVNLMFSLGLTHVYIPCGPSSRTDEDHEHFASQMQIPILWFDNLPSENYVYVYVSLEIFT